MRAAAVVVVVLLAVSAAAGSVRAYSVEPVKELWSGKAHPVLGVSEIVTCCWDELDSSCYVELFAGAHGSSEFYHLDIYEAGDGPRVAYRHDVTPGTPYAWLPFGHITMEFGQSFTKGKQYEFRFTRSGTDSINYYTAYGGTYPYGYMKVGGQDHSGPGLDNTPTDHTMA